MAITLEQAEKITNAAKAKAKEINVQMNIAIVDEGANLKAFHRMDNAWLGSVDISIKKAKTARFFDLPTGAIGVSGGWVEQDHAVASAGAAAVN